MTSCQDPPLDRRGRETDAGLWSAASEAGVVATAHYRATEAGRGILAAGGNAIDAAVAASLALAVVESAGSGIGGMAMMVVHLAEGGRTFTVEGPCRAPARATPAAVAASGRYRGHRAIAVPGYLAALDHVLERYGTQTVATVCEPAIRLAEEGARITPLQHQLLVGNQEILRRHSGGALFLDRQHRPPKVGTRFPQPALARTLRRLSTLGLRDFYEGETARALARDVADHGGFLAEADLAQLTAQEGQPLSAPLGGGTAHILGPPGGGISLAQLLYLHDSVARPVSLATPEGIVLVARMIRAVRQERRRTRLLVEARAPGRAAGTLSRSWARRLLSRLGETSHLSVMDCHGNAVALTQSLERSFGSAEACVELGFLLNGYLRAFKVQNRAHPYYLKPGAVARSNAAPTVVVRDGEAWVAIGSTGSERMVSGIFTTLLRLPTQTPFEAVRGPRLHATPDGEVLWEAGRFPPGCREALQEDGFSLVDLEDYSFRTGGLQLAVKEGGLLQAVADPRRDGGALGA